MALPLVSCLMVTRNRAGLARRAIACFHAQTWPNKELIVVDDGEEDYTPALAPYQREHTIRYHRLPPDPMRTLGSARNTSLELARGEYCAQWDDDEWYHPDRIRIQMDRMAAGAEAVVLTYTLMHLDTPDFAAHPYRARLRGGTPGTILHRKSGVRYPDLRRNEDAVFLARLAQCSRVAALERSGSHLFIRCFHGDNTWNREHFLRRLRTTHLDKCRYWLATRVRRDLFSHSAFRLNAIELEAIERFWADSRQSGVLRH